MEVEDGKHAGKVRRHGSRIGRCRSTSGERGEDNDDTRLVGAQLWVRSCCN